MSYNFLQRKPTESQAQTAATGSQHQPAAAVRVPGKHQQHKLTPQHRCRVGDRPPALPAPHPHRDTWLSPPRAPATPGRPPATPSRGARCQPPPVSGPCGDGSAPASCPTPGPGPTARRREGVPRTARRRPAGPREPLRPASRLRDGTRSSPPTPAPRRRPRQHQLRRRSRSARSRGRLLPGAPQTKPGRRQHMEWRKWRRGPRPAPKQPQPTCSCPPWNPFSRKAGFSPHRPPPAHSTMSPSTPPRPGTGRSLPPRWAAAEESCPRRSGCGKRVLAAPCVQREWSCCKMAAEAHAAGSKPDPVPLASERAPRARAPPRDPPSLSSPPGASAPLTHSLSPCPPPAPPSPPTTAAATSLRPPSPFSLSSSPPAPSPTAPAPARGRSGTTGRLSPPRSHARWLPRALSRPRPPSLPSPLLSFSLPR